jgi:hypothetical protein
MQCKECGNLRKCKLNAKGAVNRIYARKINISILQEGKKDISA